jgi:uncharacterized membrane protein YvlD (DUF360 family)
MNPVGLAIGVAFSAVLSGVMIWLVSLLGLGLKVDGIGPALVAGIVIALAGGVISWLLDCLKLSIPKGLLRFVVNVLLGAVVLFIGANLIPGLTVNGFAGALFAALAIGVMSWLLSIPLRRINERATAQG